MLNSIFPALSPNHNQGPSLFAAIRDGNEDIVRQSLNPSSKPLLEDICEEGAQTNLLILGMHSSVIVAALLEAYPKISAFDKRDALLHAVDKDHIQVMIELLTRCDDEISTNDKGMALQDAAKNGHSQAIFEILTRCGDKIDAFDKGSALMNAVRNGHPQSIVTLLNGCGGEISNEDKLGALMAAIFKGHIDTVHSLLANRSVEAVATYNNNAALTEAQKRANGDEEDRARYQPIVDRLMQIPAVATLAAQQVQHATNLAHITQFGENSMQALNAEESSIVSHLKNHYKSMYEDKGFEVIRAEILSYLEESYKKSPALDNGHPLPLEYTVNLSNSALKAYYEHLTHGAWRYLSDNNPWMAANAEYIHTFEDGRKVAIISDADKELMSYLWIALSDETIQLDNGFMVEGNKNVFAQNLGELNRAHNHDERAANPLEQQAYKNKVPGIQITTVDDLEADKPTCVYGVTKRLLESPYGHPRIKPLDPRLMQAWMESLLFGRKQKEEDLDNIVDKLDKLSLHELKNIQENLIDALSGEAFECHNTLQIAQDQLNAFIERVKNWYSDEEITKERNPKLVINPAGSGFIAKEHNSYVDLIQFCTNDPINCFAQVLNTYLTARIPALEELEKHDAEMENVNTFTLSYYDSSKKRERDEELKVQEKCRRLR
ncbi:MAG TPA: ankyrin repeat domain-containing protein [Gammaproteobacteria bacterium]|nr:ankyrin repeat domain-containing protein [Gammaproteobacteria bacterium]